MQQPKKPSITMNAAEVFAGFPQDKKRSGKLAVVSGLFIGVVLLVYLGLAVGVSGSVPRGANLAGVEIGGMKPGAAVKKLDSSLGEKLRQPFLVQLAGKTTKIDPVKGGLKPDFSATVHAETDFTLSPVKIFRHLFGSGELQLETKVEAQALKQVVADAAPELLTVPTEASFHCSGSELEPVNPGAGTELDVAKAVEMVKKNWWKTGEPLSLPGVVKPAKSTLAQLDKAAKTTAKTLLSAPVKVILGERSLEVPVEQLCKTATWVLHGDELNVKLDGKALREFALANLPDVETLPVDARFEFVNGAVRVVASQDGARVDSEEISNKVTAGAISAQNREVSVQLTPIPPEISTEDANNAGIKEVIGEFSTPLTSDSVRTKNLVKGAAVLTGVLVKPGEVFSLEKALGPVTVQNGWFPAGVTNNGFHTTGVGGGLSQVSTTTLNAAWFAGMDLLEFTPHSEWYSRYPEGRESTLWTGSIDLKWRNPNPNPVLLQGWVGGGRLHIRLWGTKYYEVKSTTSERSNIVASTTVVSQHSNCVASAGGVPGFTVSNTRTRYLNGKQHDTKTYTHKYQPQNHIICAKDQPPVPSDGAASDESGVSGAN